jgi:hypothetical protein
MANGPQISDLADRSKIVFIGTVQRLAATTVPSHLVTSHTVIVNVNRVFRAPQAVGNLAGARITVELTGGPGVRTGERAIFFSNPLIYAVSMVVEETGRVALPADQAARQARIAEVVDAIQRQPDREIWNRAATADAVVTGKVVSVQKVPRPPNQPLGEHDADWRQAVVEVQSVESGLPVKQVVVLFPGSDDVRWYGAPKFRVGQEGVWILHQNTFQDLPTPGYTALHPSDFHRKPQLNKIRAIIQGRR